SPESGDLRFRRLTAIGFALYASADYLARHRPPAPGAGFAGHDAVLFEEGFRGAPAFASLTHSLRDARAAVRANSMLSLVEAVANGLGVGALTCCLGDTDPRLRRVFPDLPVERVDPSVDDARSHAVDANPFAGDFPGETDGQGVQRRFRRGVVDVLTRRAEDGRARGDIHDRSPATPVPVGHPADGLARAQKRPG